MISIHETPIYENPKTKDADVQACKAEELRNMRKNTRDLLHQLSKPGMKKYVNRVSAQKGVRSDLLKIGHRGPLPAARTTALDSSTNVDTSANLFYYLFEDYTAATSILSLSDDVLARLVSLFPLPTLTNLEPLTIIYTDPRCTSHHGNFPHPHAEAPN